MYVQVEMKSAAAPLQTETGRDSSAEHGTAAIMSADALAVLQL